MLPTFSAIVTSQWIAMKFCANSMKETRKKDCSGKVAQRNILHVNQWGLQQNFARAVAQRKILHVNQWGLQQNFTMPGHGWFYRAWLKTTTDSWTNQMTGFFRWGISCCNMNIRLTIHFLRYHHSIILQILFGESLKTAHKIYQLAIVKVVWAVWVIQWVVWGGGYLAV